MDKPNTETTPEPDKSAVKNKWAALIVLVGGLAMIVIDGTIVGVALPVLVDDLKLNFDDAQWVNSLYSVIFAALLLTAGRLGDRLGRRRLYVVGIAIFVVGSLLASTADGATSLIVARAIQGVGGACVLPATLSSMNSIFRGKDRAVAFGVWGAVIAGVAAIGPLLGGWITTYFTWPWIFVINVPIGIALMIATYMVVPETRAGVVEPGLDVLGLFLSAFGFGALIFALIEGGTLGWWTQKADLHLFGITWSADAPLSVVPTIGTIGILLLLGFVLWERHRGRIHRSAILDMNLFFTPTFSWGNVTAMTVAIAEFGLLFVLPLYLVNALGLSTMGAGFVLAAMAGGAFISGSLARHLTALIGAPRTVILGLLLEVVGVVVVAVFVSSTVAPWLLALLLVVYGTGLGLASAQLTGITLADIPTEESGQGSATQSTVRQLGSAIGSAVVGAVLAFGLSRNLPGTLESGGVPSSEAIQLSDATRESAGSSIGVLREQGTHGQLGEAGPDVVRLLSDGFAEATRYSLYVSAAFLVLGLIGAFRVQASARLRPS
ncbi:MFS transporter [Rhodococcus sp. MS16]|uniref:MFS transporter n=1 Tax=Rhodococcus sp. MS16 TaxID=2579941 RepID=UPI0015625A03|nr:MFS transporter [Rhodococcus sp. MS16]NRI69343.1 MFS transporter [Rhodococcus sp. MS16]